MPKGQEGQNPRKDDVRDLCIAVKSSFHNSRRARGHNLRTPKPPVSWILTTETSTLVEVFKILGQMNVNRPQVMHSKFQVVWALFRCAGPHANIAWT